MEKLQDIELKKMLTELALTTAGVDAIRKQ